MYSKKKEDGNLGKQTKFDSMDEAKPSNTLQHWNIVPKAQKHCSWIKFNTQKIQLFTNG